MNEQKGSRGQQDRTAIQEPADLGSEEQRDSEISDHDRMIADERRHEHIDNIVERALGGNFDSILSTWSFEFYDDILNALEHHLDHSFRHLAVYPGDYGLEIYIDGDCALFEDALKQTLLRIANAFIGLGMPKEEVIMAVKAKVEIIKEEYGKKAEHFRDWQDRSRYSKALKEALSNQERIQRASDEVITKL